MGRRWERFPSCEHVGDSGWHLTHQKPIAPAGIESAPQSPKPNKMQPTVLKNHGVLLLITFFRRFCYQLIVYLLIDPINHYYRQAAGGGGGRESACPPVQSWPTGPATRSPDCVRTTRVFGAQ